MHLFLCVDEQMAMGFNHRRQSRDLRVYLDILTQTQGQVLYMSPYSLPLFPTESHSHILVSETFLTDAPAEAYCFVEKPPLLPFLQQIEAITLYRWNRIYPGDTFLDITLAPPDWQLKETKEFAGNSHKKITRQLYMQKLYV